MAECRNEQNVLMSALFSHCCPFKYEADSDSTFFFFFPNLVWLNNGYITNWLAFQQKAKSHNKVVLHSKLGFIQRFRNQKLRTPS